ncbi:MAG: peptidoglycan glycosyltransferase, partial [Oscillospiraceae bacterium]|nr:peptidoglycan glycosyltransferase [Oscillospiraceae bacterium]
MKATARMKQGLNIVIAVFIVWVIALGIKLAIVGIVDNETYQEKANDYHFGSITLNANRGTIYDAADRVVAQSATVYKVYIDPTLFKKELENFRQREEAIYEAALEAAKKNKDKENPSPTPRKRTEEEYKTEVIDFLTGKLELEEGKVLEATQQNTQYVILKMQVDKAIADEITEYMNLNKIGSIKIETDTKRFYPKSELAASVIGFTNIDGIGQEGLEKYYDDYLTGTNGRVISAKDAHGDEMPYRYQRTYEAQQGNNLYLTLDTTLQHYLEKALTEMIVAYNVTERACGIIMNAKTGAVLAMASCPGYDLNNPRTLADPNIEEKINSFPGNTIEEKRQNAMFAQWKNKAINEIYIPGSGFKV